MPTAVSISRDLSCASTPEEVLSILKNDFFFTEEIGPKDAHHLHPSTSWGAVVWLEVDSSMVEPWLRKAATQAEMGKVVVALLPARTNTRAFHQWVLGCASEIRFVRGRLKHGGRRRQSPFASVVAIFDRTSGVGHAAMPISPTTLDVVAF
jgi:hypothetical protein